MATTAAPGIPGAPGARAGSGRRVQPISVRTLTTEAQLVSGGCVLHSWNVRETTGAAGGVVEIYDGSSNQGQFLGTIGVGNGSFGAVAFSEHGVDVLSGIHAHIVTGSMDVIVYVELLPPAGAE